MPWYLSPRSAQRAAQLITEGLVLLAGAAVLALAVSGLPVVAFCQLIVWTAA